jgi:hypothetical protein
MPTKTTPVLTAAQEKRRAAIERRLRRALHDAEALAIEAGCRPDDVELYFESGGAISVLNGQAHDEHNNARHDRVVFVLDWYKAVNTMDCGGW